MTPGFSERTFEFCFNAEYCRLNSALLATFPNIPSQRLEKELGYDVEFEINKGSYTRSLFLQHKVPILAERKAGSNATFYSVHAGPYFRFPVDNDQHNTLCDLSLRKGDAFYCAPRFTRRGELDEHYRASDVGTNSILINPLDVGDINDNARHNVTFNPLGQNPTLHSEPLPFKRSYSGGKDNGPELQSVTVNTEYIQQLRADLLRRFLPRQSIRWSSSVTPTTHGLPPVTQVQLLLAHVFQISWILLP